MPTALAPTIRYTDQGTTRVYFLPTIASPALAPTRTELDNGTDLSGQVSDITGWITQSAAIDALTLASRFQRRAPGLATLAEASLVFYGSRNGNDIRTLLGQGTSGYVVFCDGGDATGNLAEVFPVTVAALGAVRTAIGKDAMKVIVKFAVTARPARVPLPTTGTGLFPSDGLYPSDSLFPV